MILTEKKYRDASWDFVGANTKKFTHCYHNYPAMMIPQIAERLLEKYGANANLLFDPYCGTGTSLVEANLKGIDAIGTDLNPLARLVAKTKTSKINLQVLELYLKDFNDYIFSVMFDFSKVSVVIPKISNIDFWFDKPVQEKLAVIKAFIEKIEDESVSNFFKVAFSETVRESSLTRNGEFKLFRMTPEQIEKFNPDVFGLMQSKLARNHRGLREFLEHRPKGKAEVYGFNTCNEVQYLEHESVDLVLTSPPYGDSRTTVAYGQFSRLSNEWLGIENANQVDNLLMGGKSERKIRNFNSKCLNESLEKIASVNESRAKEIASFYYDYQKSIENVARTVKKGGYACYVVGNRKVKGEILPTDEITKDFFENYGFSHVETIIRKIPSKRMPSKNSPTNITGKKDETMNYEYIVVMRKESV
ncbi:MAG: DNA methyltransferase [Candidatus Thermochlorobacter aerophilum]|jgi:tRNA G10  N-methylase Trm11|uniref:site-specific DNA-methyltransferase (cytosine-N(4)-specific) n=1 Tax=Candidatus Thermochlorobacter aerophilus TaxID=1868324 RepID=A0A395LX07_9BACT|nr:MAG: DNA methyltransferase [Candidatus Thermochlorobacter aerophilum]